uniref:Uncharacterized protein n=1 Tax=Rhizophora mucronata TaxID=61149 RepID=A0A2P2PGW0_RHIMU
MELITCKLKKELNIGGKQRNEKQMELQFTSICSNLALLV